MSPHTDPGALLKLAERLRAAATSFEGQRAWHANAVDGDCEPHDSWQIEMDDASKAAIEAAEILTRQAASQGRAGGDRDGWKLVPTRPTQTQMDAGLYQSSADSEWADVYSIYADMIDAAPSIDDGDKPVSPPVKTGGEAECACMKPGGDPLANCEVCDPLAQEAQQSPIRNVGYNASTSDIRWAVNVLLEKIAERFDKWDTADVWRDEAAATVRSFKHPTPSVPSAHRGDEA